jgi:anti-sigma factor ChrR (cupin superfamily)
MLASDGLETAPWTRRLAVRLHLAMCRHCRNYAAQIRAIGRAARDVVQADAADAGTLSRLEASILSSAGDRAGSKGDGESRSKKSSDPLDNEDFS